jgi:hypothetical protein
VCENKGTHKSEILMKNYWNSQAEKQRLRVRSALVIIVNRHVHGYVRTYVCMYLCMCVFMYYVCIYLCMHVCIYECMYYVCTSIRMFRRILIINGIKNSFLVLETQRAVSVTSHTILPCTKGSAMVQAISRRPLAAEARDR